MIPVPTYTPADSKSGKMYDNITFRYDTYVACTHVSLLSLEVQLLCGRECKPQCGFYHVLVFSKVHRTDQTRGYLLSAVISD